EIGAPQLLDALDGLARLEAGLDHLEVLALIAAGALGDLVDHRGEIRIEHAEPHRVRIGAARDRRRRYRRGGRGQQIPARDHLTVSRPSSPRASSQWLLSRRMTSVSSRRSALACAELRSRGRGRSTVTYSPTRPGDDVMMAMRSAR